MSCYSLSVSITLSTGTVSRLKMEKLLILHCQRGSASYTGRYKEWELLLYAVECVGVVSTLSVELSSLGPLLGQIVVALSPLVDKHSADISCIFEYLIVENR